MNRIIEWIVTIITLLFLWVSLSSVFFGPEKKTQERLEKSIVAAAVVLTLDIFLFVPFVFLQNALLRLFGCRTHTWGENKGRFF